MKRKAILIDDEIDGREILANYLAKYCENIELVDSCENIIEGEKSIKEHQPDIVFLDIEMPYGNGFDLLEKFDRIDFEVIFVTAYSNYAVKALNLSAAYYLLKPIDIDALIDAVEKVEAKLDSKKEFDLTEVVLKNIQAINSQDQKLVLPNLHGFDLINISEIMRCEAMDNYTNIHLVNGKKYVISKTLKHFENLLVNCDFMRVHKSHLINLKKVKQYIKGRTAQLILEDNSEIDLSATRKEEFLKRFM